MRSFIECIAAKAGRVAMLLLMAASAPTAAAAQDAAYPTRAITWVVPFGPGSLSDTTTRQFAKALSDEIGQPVVIENKPGAGGIIGTEYVAKAKPDGYTMLMAVSATMAANPSIHKTLPYSPLESFVPVTGTTSSPMLLLVNASKPYKTLDEFVDFLKKNPGAVSFGTAGKGTTQHLAGEMLQNAVGSKMLHVPYKDSAAMLADLLSGTVDAAFEYGVTMRPHIEAGKLIPIAITRDERLNIFPDVPTFREKGIDVFMTSWGSAAVPAGTPAEIVGKLSAALEKASRQPQMVKFFEDNSVANLTVLGSEKTREFYASEAVKYKKLFELAGIQPQ